MMGDATLMKVSQRSASGTVGSWRRQYRMQSLWREQNQSWNYLTRSSANTTPPKWGERFHLVNQMFFWIQTNSIDNLGNNFIPKSCCFIDQFYWVWTKGSFELVDQPFSCSCFVLLMFLHSPQVLFYFTARITEERVPRRQVSNTNGQ